MDPDRAHGTPRRLARPNRSDELGLDNVEVLRARAEDWRRGPVLDAATARAVSALRTLVPLTAPLVRDGGELILLKGASAATEIDAADKQLRKYRLSNVRLEVVGEGLLDGADARGPGDRSRLSRTRVDATSSSPRSVIE